MKTTRTMTTGVLLTVSLLASVAVADQSVDEALKKIDVKRGVVGVLNLAENDAGFVVDLAKASELTLYFQSADAGRVAGSGAKRMALNTQRSGAFPSVRPRQPAVFLCLALAIEFSHLRGLYQSMYALCAPICWPFTRTDRRWKSNRVA